MDKILEQLKKIKEIYIVVAFIVSLTIGSYIKYTDLINTVETTQIIMLKMIIREFEVNHKCIISDTEWDEYILNYSTLFDLKISHKMLSQKADWEPIERSYNKCKEKN